MAGLGFLWSHKILNHDIKCVRTLFHLHAPLLANTVAKFVIGGTMAYGGLQGVIFGLDGVE